MTALWAECWRPQEAPVSEKQETPEKHLDALKLMVRTHNKDCWAFLGEGKMKRADSASIMQ